MINRFRMPNEKCILFVDTETTGIPIDQSYSFKNIDNWPTIRQIAWIIYKKDGTLVSKNNYSMSPDNSPAISLNTQYQPNVIKPIYEVLDYFLQSIRQCDVIVGHNISYDVQVILCELYRYGKDTSELESIQQFCTMRNAITICGFDTRRGERYPKLQELYSKLFHRPFEGAHDAYCDIKATADCFWALFTKGMLNKHDFPYLLSSTEMIELANEYINMAVEIVDEYLRKLGREESSLNKALLFFDKALQMTPKISHLVNNIKAKVGDACLNTAKDLRSMGKILLSDLFLKKAVDAENAEAMAQYALCVHDSREKENLLIRAFNKGWIDAAYYLYSYRPSFFSSKWRRCCEEYFDNLSDKVAHDFISDLAQSGYFQEAKNLCERSIANGHDNYRLYERVLMLSGEWSKRFEVLNRDYDKCLQNIESIGGVDTIKDGEYRNERQGVLNRLAPIVECLFEGIGTVKDHKKAKELIDFGFALYKGRENEADYYQIGLLYYYLGQYYENGLLGISIDKSLAFGCYQKSSKRLPITAKFFGKLHLYGIACKLIKK